MKSRSVVIAAAAASCLGGCAAVGDLTGAAAGLLTGAATANPAIGISVGIAVRSGTNELLDRVARARKANEHDAIAAAAADMGVGESGAWSIDQEVVGDAQGEVRVLRIIETPLALCKELLFSVAEEKQGERHRAWFTTTACQRDGGWKWANAEPAVERWLNLQ